MTARLAAVCGLAFVLAACATPYTTPEGENVARIRVLAAQTRIFGAVRVMGYSSGECEDPMNLGMIGGFAKLADQKTLNMPRVEEYIAKTYLERSISAQHTYMISVSLLGDDGCTLTATFTPERNGDYEAIFAWARDRSRCRLSIHRLVAGTNESPQRIDEPSATPQRACKKGFLTPEFLGTADAR